MNKNAAGFKVVLPLAVSGESEKYPQKFTKLGAEFAGQHCSSDEEFIALAKDADAVITVGSIRPVPRNVIENLAKCRLISNTQIGYDSIDTEAAAEQGILVTNVPDYCTEEVSDHAMALLLACARKTVRLNEAAKRGQWGLSASGVEIQSQVWPKMSRLQGQTFGLLGLGKVSRTLVPKAKGFQLRVIAYDPYVSPEVARQIGVELVDWKHLLRESDFISLHSALTPETKCIFNAEAFREMKPTACLINTARGGLVDEIALCQALKDGEIAMAALDVTDPEPPQSQNPLITMDNVIITAHSAFFSPTSEAERWHRPVEEVARIMRGEWPRALVNPHAKKKYIARWGTMKEPG
ncbi:C-terminal binding protein [Chloroflexota bacterium]